MAPFLIEDSFSRIRADAKAPGDVDCTGGGLLWQGANLPGRLEQDPDGGKARMIHDLYTFIPKLPRIAVIPPRFLVDLGLVAIP